MRTVVAFLAGMIVGAAMLWITVVLTGGWYTYVILPAYECQDPRTTAEVVPHQPNPCHFRRPRWQIVR
jgi:hypothetical protein